MPGLSIKGLAPGSDYPGITFNRQDIRAKALIGCLTANPGMNAGVENIPERDVLAPAFKPGLKRIPENRNVFRDGALVRVTSCPKRTMN